MQTLPVSVRTRVAEAYNTFTVQRNAHLFAGCNDQFLSRLMLSLGEIFLMPGELVLKHGDIARELTFVKKGVLMVTDAKGTLVELISGEGASCQQACMWLFGLCTASTWPHRVQTQLLGTWSHQLAQLFTCLPHFYLAMFMLQQGCRVVYRHRRCAGTAACSIGAVSFLLGAMFALARACA